MDKFIRWIQKKFFKDYPRYFSVKERKRDLKNLIQALQDLIAALIKIDFVGYQLADYQLALAVAKQLFENGFMQEDLTSLAKQVPQLWRLAGSHWDGWEPVLQADIPPQWHNTIKPLHDKVVLKAYNLHIVGEILPER